MSTPAAAPLTLLVTGGEGMLAHALRAEAAARGHRVLAYSHEELDVTDRAAVHRTIVASRPDAVLYCAAQARVDEAEGDPDTAFAVNAEGARNVAAFCAGVGARFVYPSTDYVFGGDATQPYRPDDPIAPASVYARSKAAGEDAARWAGDWLVVRTSWLFGAGGRQDFLSDVLRRARAGESLRAVNDHRSSPSWTADVASAILNLLERGAPKGTYHACNSGDATRFELARAAVEAAGLTVDVVPISSAEDAAPAPRPRYSVLDCSVTEAIIGAMPDWRTALQRALTAGL